MIAMNILVCFKVTPDLDQLPPDGWEVDRCFDGGNKFC